MRDEVRVVASAPEDSHDPILYPMAVIRDSRQKESAQRFIEFVLSPEGQAILQHKGFQGASEK
jgi:molybdate transport system substrate-binding protein